MSFANEIIAPITLSNKIKFFFPMGQSNAAAKYFQVPISQKKPNLSEVWNENFAVFDQT